MMTIDEFLQQWSDGNDRLLVHTSGSTGLPKPLWVEKARMRASARMTCDFLGLKAGDTALLCMPLDYIAGKMMVVRALERGLRLICIDPSGHPMCPTTQKVYDFSQSTPSHSGRPSPPSEGSGEVVAFAAMVPLQVWNSLQVPEERERLRMIRHLIIGGGAIDDKLAEELKDFPNAVWSTYGMTETLSHIALRRLNGPARSEWYEPLPGVTVSLNADGCLVIDAPHLCDRLLVTNDIGEQKSGGAFRILGRRDNVVCTGGVKIQMEEVERKLAGRMAVPFLITKRSDEKFGEVVVMLHEGGAVEELRQVCRQLLTKYEQPRLYLSVDRLPMTETGKPARKRAEQLAEASQ